MTVALKCQHLFFKYEEAPILNDVSFEVYHGESIGVIGPNGGGKSTLLKLILGFLDPSSGEINVLGTSPKLAQGKVAYVPQNVRYDRYFPISTFELVLSGRLAQLPWYGRFKPTDIDIADEALENVGLSSLAKRPFGTLSGGQQQRVLIARALAAQPEIVLLDEPTASVDSAAEQDILGLLKKLKGKMTILMVTHDLQTALHQVDRVFCVQHEVTSYSPSEVCEHYVLGLYHPPLLNFPRKPST